ncbi:MAG: hypothetical protein A3F13_08675 [Gammaproteobacteria bacterium RIFCSPHIGHO2_12_FULL_40_19]|nr:MAG: hypothetical protein A3F13_08675 [Gammaproteobacteria bacterium RIFCSPHIGHO2_12_FULL_40_19]
MGRKKKHRGAAGETFKPMTFDESPADAQEPLVAEAPQTEQREDGSTYFMRVREETRKAAAERLEAERLALLLHRKSAFLGQVHSEESEQRDALQKKMHRENPETVRATEALVQEILDHAMRADLQRRTEHSLIRTQEMLHRNDIGDKAIKEHLSIWAKFQKPPVPSTQQRIAERNQDATAELQRRTVAATSKRAEEHHRLFSQPKRPAAPTSPTFDMVGQDEAQQQAATTPKPRWW